MSKKQAVFSFHHNGSAFYDNIFEKLTGEPYVKKMKESRKGMIHIFFEIQRPAHVIISPHTGGLQILYTNGHTLRAALKLLGIKGIINLGNVKPILLDQNISVDFLLPGWELLERKEKWTHGFVGPTPENVKTGIRIFIETWRNVDTGEKITRVGDKFLRMKITPKTRRFLEKIKRLLEVK